MNSITFNSPYTALLWERFRCFFRNSHWLLACTLLPYLVMLAIVGLIDPEDIHNTEELLKSISMYLPAVHMLLCHWLLADKDTRNKDVFYPQERHYLLPVNSYTLACTQTLFSTSTIILYWSTLYYINYYIFSESVVHASDWFIRVSNWSLGITCYLVMITARLLLSSISMKLAENISAILCFGYVFIGTFLTDSLSNSIIGLFALILIFFVSILNVIVSRKYKCNTELNIRTLISNLSFDRLQLFQNNFVTPFQAQLWYEWREWGKFCLIISIVIYVLCLNFFGAYRFNYIDVSFFTNFFNNYAILSIWVCFIAGAIANKSQLNRCEFILPIAAEFLYNIRFVISIIISLFFVTLPQIIIYSHNTNSSNINYLEIFVLIIFTTSLGILILANPLVSINLYLFYSIILLSIYIFPEDIISIPLLFFTLFVLLINIYLYTKCAYKNFIYYPVLSILFTGLLGSYFIFSRFIEGILFTLFMLMTYFIGLHWFVRSRCR